MGDRFVMCHARWTPVADGMLRPEKLALPLRWRKPRHIEVMDDVFHEGLSSEAIGAVFGVMAAAPRHTFQVLTKRPERMREWFRWVKETDFYVDVILHSAAHELGDGSEADESKWLWTLCENADAACFEIKWPLPNVWLGVSVEDQPTADRRVPTLLECPAAVRWVSYEPALAGVSFQSVAGGDDRFPGRLNALDGVFWPALGDVDREHAERYYSGAKLDWIVVGGESGPEARPFDLAWARQTVEQCRAAGAAVFVKQLGARPFDMSIPAGPRVPGRLDDRLLLLRSRSGDDMAEWPEDLRVREFPEAVAGG